MILPKVSDNKQAITILVWFTDKKDYRSSTTVSIPANTISKSFIINIINDEVSECNESFKLMLSTSSCGVVIGSNNTSEVMIRDDDG